MLWAVERADGGRGVGFTGGHWHRNWANDDFRRVVLNAIVWTAGMDVPETGVKSEPVTEAQLNENLDEKKDMVQVEAADRYRSQSTTRRTQGLRVAGNAQEGQEEVDYQRSRGMGLASPVIGILDSGVGGLSALREIRNGFAVRLQFTMSATRRIALMEQSRPKKSLSGLRRSPITCSHRGQDFSS